MQLTVMIPLLLFTVGLLILVGVVLTLRWKQTCEQQERFEKLELEGGHSRQSSKTPQSPAESCRSLGVRSERGTLDAADVPSPPPTPSPRGRLTLDASGTDK